MLRFSRLLLVLPGLLLAVGCGDPLASPTLLNGPRILALQATPLEPVLGETVTVVPVVHLPATSGTPVVEASFCPFSLGSQSAYACIDPVCERAVTPGADGSVSFDPSTEAFACATALGLDPGAGAPGTGEGELPPTLETHLRYRLEVDGQVLEAVQRLPLHLEAPTDPVNRAPVIAEVQIDGLPMAADVAPVPVSASAEITVEIDGASLDAIPGTERSEEPTLAFFATSGEFDFAFAFGDAVTMGYRPDPAATEVELWVVARDGRGGQAAFGPVHLQP